jgi:hypothetical protein
MNLKARRSLGSRQGPATEGIYAAHHVMCAENRSIPHV